MTASARPEAAAVGIIIPTKDRWRLLAESVASLRAQSYGGWHALVIDDGSREGPPDEEWDDLGRVTIQPRRQGTAGAPACRNQGVERVGTEYVVFLDSDDLLAPFCLEQRVTFMQTNPALDFAVFPCALFRDRPGDTDLLWNVDTAQPDLDRFLRGDPPWGVHCVIWRRAALARMGPWDEACLSWQDIEFHTRALAMGLRYAKVDEPDCFWRMSREGTIGAVSLEPEHLRSHSRLMDGLAHCLRESGALTERRSRALAGCHFWLAREWARRGRVREAFGSWFRARRGGLVRTWRFAEGVAYISVRRRQRLERLARAYLRRSWPREMWDRRSGTFRKVPMGADARLRSWPCTRSTPQTVPGVAPVPDRAP